MYLLLKILYNLSIPNYCYLSGSTAPALADWLSELSLHCTVQFLKYGPVASIIGWRIQEPGVRDLWWGSLLQCSWQLEWAYVLGPFRHEKFSHVIGTKGGKYNWHIDSLVRLELQLHEKVSLWNLKGITTPSIKRSIKCQIVSHWVHCVHGDTLLDTWEWVWGQFGASSEASPVNILTLVCSSTTSKYCIHILCLVNKDLLKLSMQLFNIKI